MAGENCGQAAQSSTPRWTGCSKQCSLGEAGVESIAVHSSLKDRQRMPVKL